MAYLKKWRERNLLKRYAAFTIVFFITAFILVRLFLIYVDSVKYVIITAASSNHYHVLTKFLNQFPIYHKQEVIVFDIGLTNAERKDFRLRFPYRRLVRFPVKEEDLKRYDWKLKIYYQMSQKHEQVVWMDSGNLVYFSGLRQIQKKIDRNGYFTTFTSGSVSDWTHPAMISFFDFQNVNVFQDRMYNGAVFGFDNKRHESVVRELYKCAMNPKCITPEGSSRENHRQDQSVLTMIMRNHSMLDVQEEWFIETHVWDGHHNHKIESNARSIIKYFFY